jgi:hypothetical protein
MRKEDAVADVHDVAHPILRRQLLDSLGVKDRPRVHQAIYQQPHTGTEAVRQERSDDVLST